MHEYYHTDVGGGFSHGDDVLNHYGNIDLPDLIGNQIRQEMSIVTGTDWGQRTSYSPLMINGALYLPFSNSTKAMLRISNMFDGQWQSHSTYAPPSNEVVKFPYKIYF